jgi:hypothetical protein
MADGFATCWYFGNFYLSIVFECEGWNWSVGNFPDEVYSGKADDEASALSLAIYALSRLTFETKTSLSEISD